MLEEKSEKRIEVGVGEGCVSVKKSEEWKGAREHRGGTIFYILKYYYYSPLSLNISFLTPLSLLLLNPKFFSLFLFLFFFHSSRTHTHTNLSKIINKFGLGGGGKRRYGWTLVMDDGIHTIHPCGMWGQLEPGI